MARNIAMLVLATTWLLIAFPLAGFASPLPSLQELVNRTPAGEEVKLEPTTYGGPVVIDKPLVLDGKGKVTIDGQGRGSVLVIRADGVVIKDMIITNSGGSHDQVDAGIQVRSSGNRIVNNRIENCLFGIDLQEAHENQVIGNEISSKDRPLGLRGDGIRCWAGHRNVFKDNRIHDSRDMVIWYSNDNVIEDNVGWNNRYSLHFMYSGGNTVRHNTYHHNTVGIFLMYSRDILVEGNTVRYSLGGTGVGIGLKEADNMTVRDNEVVYCTSGFYFDLSPFQPEKYNFILANTIAYNIVGIDFNSTVSRNILKGNGLIDNLVTVKVRGNGVADGNVWEGNYYSDYQGFDRDRDGYGDFAFNYDVYLDTLWMDNDWMLLFAGSPVISVLNLLAKLAPISEPRRLFTDHKPVFSSRDPLLVSEQNLAYTPPKIDLDEEEDEEVPARFSGLDDEEEDEESLQELEEARKNDANFNRYFFRQ